MHILPPSYMSLSLMLVLIVAGFVLAGLVGWLIECRSHASSSGSVVASWYGESYRGKTMANGKAYNPDKISCASYLYPIGSTIEVTIVRPRDGFRKSIIVDVTDRGPNVQGRHIDLSRAAFAQLAPLEIGLIRVRPRLISDHRD